MRAGVSSASFRGGEGSIKVVFATRQGPQEQVVAFPIGDWLVDWHGAPRIEYLRVRPGSAPQVALATVSGACELTVNRCDLNNGFQERHIRVRDAR